MSDATYGTVTVGRLVLRETFTVKADVHAQTGVRTVNIEGQESIPPLTVAQLRQRNEDIMTLRSMIIPIFWTNKQDFNGLYMVDDVSAELTDYIQGVASFNWTIRARRIGPTNSAEIESRLTGITRKNDFGKTGTLWHAPAIGHNAYYTGSTRPASFVDRASEDGNVRVYYPIPSGVSPRWSTTPQGFLQGRARIKIDGAERTGTNVKEGTTWEVSNGVINITPAPSGGIALGTWNGTAYETKTWNVSVGASATPIGDYQSMSVLRNDFEMATIRLVKTMNPVGRSTLDLSVRRGSRIVEGYLETDTSATLAVGLALAENGSAPASGGYVAADASDADGNRAIVGTARTFVAQTGRVGVQKNAAVAMDFFVGAEATGAPLSLANGSFETNTTGWTPTSCTFVRSNEAAKVGSWSGKITTTGTPAQAFVRPTAVPVVVGREYRVVMWAMAPSGYSSVSAAIDFFNGGSYLTTNALAKSLPSGIWVPFVHDAVAPASATMAQYGPTIGSNPPTSTVVYIDEVWFYDGVNTGDKFTDLANQYIGSLAEITMAVLR